MGGYVNTEGTFDGFSIYSLSVHWVTDPDDRMSRRLNSLDMIWQMRANLEVAQSGVKH
jgi:hypothetical protein